MQHFICDGKVYHFENGELYHKSELLGSFLGLKEAKEFAKSLSLYEDNTQQEAPFVVTDQDIAVHLYESGETRVTESLVSYYKEIIESGLFFPSNTVLEFKVKQQELPGKVQYQLNDGSFVLIDEETNRQLNNLNVLKEHHDILLYMNTNTEQFIHTIEELTRNTNGDKESS